MYTFDGAGYAVMDKIRFREAIYNGFAIDFSTYWENATLLFVGNEENVSLQGEPTFLYLIHELHYLHYEKEDADQPRNT